MRPSNRAWNVCQINDRLRGGAFGCDGFHVRVSLRSVNHRFLDFRVRLSEGSKPVSPRFVKSFAIVCGAATSTSRYARSRRVPPSLRCSTKQPPPT